MAISTSIGMVMTVMNVIVSEHSLTAIKQHENMTSVIFIIHNIIFKESLKDDCRWLIVANNTFNAPCFDPALLQPYHYSLPTVISPLQTKHHYYTIVL